MVRNGQKGSERVRYVHNNQKWTKGLEMVKKGQKWSDMFRNVQKWSKRVKRGQKVVTNLLKFGRKSNGQKRSQKVSKWSKLGKCSNVQKIVKP